MDGQLTCEQEMNARGTGGQGKYWCMYCWIGGGMVNGLLAHIKNFSCQGIPWKLKGNTAM